VQRRVRPPEAQPRLGVIRIILQPLLEDVDRVAGPLRPQVGLAEGHEHRRPRILAEHRGEAIDLTFLHRRLHPGVRRS
jgi:hypothetical protein